MNDTPSPEVLVPLCADPAVRRVERRLVGLALLTAGAIALVVLNDLIAPARESGPEVRGADALRLELRESVRVAPAVDLLEARKRPKAVAP